MASRRPSETLMGAMRELLEQSERVARAETRVAASRVVDIAQGGAKRGSLAAVAVVLASCSLLYLIHAAYLALATRIAPWIAALCIALGCALIAAVFARSAFRTLPIGAVESGPLLQTGHIEQ
jgi:Putative Actinobacterial Holin-X, holin superfamily III